MELNYLNNDTNLINMLSVFFDNPNKFDFSLIKSKLWKSFLTNDGSVTKILTILFDNKLTLNLIYNENIFDKKESDFCKLKEFIEKLAKTKIESGNFIMRKINFLNNNDIKMIGISIWDEDAYNDIYNKESEYSKPMGLIFREKEIEYYRTIENYIVENETNFILLRLSNYKIKGKTSLLLMEIFNSETYDEIFGKFN